MAIKSAKLPLDRAERVECFIAAPATGSSVTFKRLEQDSSGVVKQSATALGAAGEGFEWRIEFLQVIVAAEDSANIELVEGDDVATVWGPVPVAEGPNQFSFGPTYQKEQTGMGFGENIEPRFVTDATLTAGFVYAVFYKVRRRIATSPS